VSAGPDFVDDFDGPTLDTDVWLPHYLPQWSSRAASAATWRVTGSCLELSIPPEQPLWCPDQEPTPLRVSGVQSGVFSGPVGSRVGQQPMTPSTVVREEQPLHVGWAPTYGRLEMRLRMELSPRSMAAWWLVGLEDEPRRCGELCVVEVFGDAVTDDGAAVGMGVKQIRDPGLRQDFEAPHLPIDVADFHDYALDWRPGSVDFLVDGTVVRTVQQAPDYPMQSMVAVFDFPGKPAGADPAHVPRLVVDRVRGWPPVEPG
jgi:Glycosyl hydrolases family 16